MIRRKKYNNTSCKCHQGHIHDSAGEAGYCDELTLLVKAGELRSYESQVTFDLKVNGKTICQHRPDFVVTKNDGTEEIREYKGFCTAVFNLKHKLFKACYPEIPYVIIPHRSRRR